MPTKIAKTGKRRARAVRADRPAFKPGKADPTRTTTIRRSFAEHLKRQFARLKGALVALVVRDDAFGLRDRIVAAPPLPGPTANAVPLLPVPDVRQRSDHDCGPAAAAAVCGLFGVGPERYGAHADGLGTTERDGTDPKALVSFLRARGLGVEARHGRSVADLAALTAAGRPVLCAVQLYGTPAAAARDRTGHYVVVTGVVGGRVHFQDPSAGPRSLPADAFEQIWHDKGADGTPYVRWGLAAGAKPDVHVGPPAVANSFCPTGEGGGIDPSCSPGETREFRSAGAVRTAAGEIPVHYDPEVVSPEAAARAVGWLARVPAHELAKSAARRIEVYENPEDMYARMEERGIDPGLEPSGEVRGAYDFSTHTLYASTWNGTEHHPRTLLHELGHSIVGVDEDLAEGWAQAHLPRVHRTTENLLVENWEALTAEEQAAVTDARMERAVWGPITNASPAEVARAALATDPSPTPAQAEAGNYRKGKVQVHGLTVTLETPRGVRRVGHDLPLPAHYGYLNRTEGADGDAVDVFLGPHPDAPTVWVLDQVGPDGAFDEHKVLLGFATEGEARTAYALAYPAGWRIGPLTALTVPEFRAWLRSGATDRPLSLPAPAANAAQYAFHADPDKLRAFHDWLKGQLRSVLVGKTEEELWRRYVEAGWRKGAGRAFDDVNGARKALSAGDQRKLDFYDGSRAEFLRSSFGAPESVEKVKLLAARSFDDLEGVTDEMSVRMSRALTDGLVQGQGPAEVARALNDVADLGLSRAMTVARTELIAAHAEGQLTALEQLGVEEVGAAVEFSDAGDDAVCPKCQALEGVVLKLAEAHGVIPVHPGCRCAWIPANVGEDDDDQKDTKGEIDAAFGDAGLDVTVGRERPESILNRLLANAGDNCGIGAGGFQPGNTCAKGSKGGTAKAGKGPSLKEQAQAIVGGKLRATKERAFTGKPSGGKISKQLAGAIGEEVLVAHLRSLGLKDARPMNLDRNNFPIDLIQDHETIEAKTGQASNGSKAQQWRLTIGEPGKAEKAWLKTLSKEEKRAWNADKQAQIHERKLRELKALEKELGHPVKPVTMTVILNHETRTADIYRFEGWHDRIGWTSEQAQAGYVRSVKYG